MNIFYLDSNPAKAAQLLADKHVVKMIVESCQMLATAHHLCGSTATYRPTHVNHPSNIWVRQSRQHYLWLWLHAIAIGIEYHARYGKIHKCVQYLTGELNVPPSSLPDLWMVPPPQCMPDKYKVRHDTVKAYTQYYLTEKVINKGLKWKKGIPEKYKSIIKYE